MDQQNADDDDRPIANAGTEAPDRADIDRVTRSIHELCAGKPWFRPRPEPRPDTERD